MDTEQNKGYETDYSDYTMILFCRCLPSLLTFHKCEWSRLTFDYYIRTLCESKAVRFLVISLD